MSVIKLEGKRTYPHQRRQPRMYSYQQEAIEWMDIREQDRVTPGGFLCHEMGLGKTHIMCALIRSRLVRRTIVLTTKSTIESWASTLREHSNFAFDVRTKIEELPAARPLVLVVTHQSVLRNHEWLEAQFFDRGIVDVCERLANAGIRVIAAGLDQDYLGRPFSPMPELMAIAEEVTKVHAVCTVCGGPASRSQRLIAETSTVLVGGSESYEARCRACFEPRDVPRTVRASEPPR